MRTGSGKHCQFIVKGDTRDRLSMHALPDFQDQDTFRATSKIGVCPGIDSSIDIATVIDRCRRVHARDCSARSYS